MNPLDTLRMAMSAISRNKIRSFLTTLGIVIGVASVIAMVHIGQAATQSVTDQISAMGTNLLIVQPGRGRGPGGQRVASRPFDEHDVRAIAQQLEGVRVAAVTTTSQSVVFGNANDTLQIVGTTNEYFEIRTWGLTSGRSFEPREEQAGTAVCVLGQTVVDGLFGGADPVGQALRIGRASCTVIGVLERKGQAMGQDQDEVIVMPLKAVQRRVEGNREIDSVYVSAIVDGTTPKVRAELEALLRERRAVRPGEPDNFFVRDMEELAATLEGTTQTLTALLGAIAAVSLLVGGIGIMNIMLVSVTERTREIGTRLAIGARAGDVLMQFLVEAIALATLGGLLGIGLGVGGSWLATQQLKLPFVLSPDIMLVGFGFAAGIGVFFGYFPARKAARLNPIEALRHE